MTTRERVLLCGMGAAVLWGGVSIGLGVIRENLSTSKEAHQKEAILLFATEQRERIAPLRLSDQEKRILDKAVAAWAASPFVNRVADAHAVQERVREFEYTGFIDAGPHRFAILNGHEYRVKEAITSSDFLVESIQLEQVVLISSSGGRRMTIALKTSNDQRESP